MPEKPEGDTPTRDRLLAAALSLFAAHGFEGVSMRDVEREAEVNRGLAAYHFRNKEGLWRAAVDVLIARWSKELESTEAVLWDLPPAERVRLLLLAFTRFSARNVEFFRMFVLNDASKGPHARYLDDQFASSMRFFRRVSGGPGPSATPEDEAIVVLATWGAAATIFALKGVCLNVFDVDPEDPAFRERAAQVVADLFHRLFIEQAASDSALPMR